MNMWRLGAAFAFLSLLACGSQRDGVRLRQAGTAEAGAIEAAFTVDTATVQLPLELHAQLYVERDAAVVARAQGTVDSLFVELGDRVSSGQLLARLESADQEIALSSADAAYENLDRVAKRARALMKSGGTTIADSEQVEFQLRQADIARRKARHDFELTRVTAPFYGVVTMRSVRPRRFVAVGETLFRVTEAAPLYARVRVPEASAGLLRAGQPATVIGANGERGAATIVHTAPIIDAASGTREVVLRLTSASAGLVSGASVVVQLASERRRIVTAPRAAIAPEGYALVVENGRSTLRPVSIGRDLGNGRVEVVSGLSPGEHLARPAR
jgi:RND family efflux transporter MFP subunit